MFLKNRVFLLLIWISACLSSCKVDSLNDPIVIPAIDTDFSLNLLENLHHPNNPLEIHFETILNENCLNTSVLSSYKKEADHLVLTIFDILEPENCDHGIAPAKGLESIYSITPNNNYTLQIELKDIVSNTGSLAVTDTYYKVEMNEEHGISWEHTKLFKIPQGALWGYITYTSDEQLPVVTDFITTLEGGTTAFNQSDGYYGHFSIDNGDIISIKGIPLDANTEIFIQIYSDSQEAMNNLVENFRAGAPDGVKLHLYDGKGNEW